MNEEQELNQIEISIEQAKKKIEIGKCLQRLSQNADFKSLILDRYLGTYAADMVKNKANISCQDESNQRFINAQIIAIGELNSYLHLIMQEANQAEKAVQDAEEAKEEILTGEVMQ